MAREVVEKLVGAIERRDADALSELFAPDAVLHHPLSPKPIEGKAAIAESEQALFDGFSDIVVEVLGVVAAADDVAVELVIRATNTGALDIGADEKLPPTGRRVELPSVWFLKLGADGRISEERDYLDTMSFFRQLGVVSEI
jgi:steroid delta-isomerase-like uncharacterized protein